MSHPHTSHLLEKVSNAQEKALFFFHLFLNFLRYSELSLCFLLSFLSMLGLGCGTQASLAVEHGLLSRASVVVAHRLRCPHGMWDLPRPEIEPLSPALESRSSTTGPPGKSLRTLLIQAKEPNLTNSKCFFFFFISSREYIALYNHEVHELLHGLDLGFFFNFYFILKLASQVVQW